MHADAAGNKSVVPFNRQVVDSARAELRLADDGAQVPVVIDEAVVSAKRVNLDKGVELVEYPVVGRGV